MGNSLDAYRAAIGMFNLRHRKSNGPIDFRAETYQEILLTNLRCSFHFVALLILQSLNPNVNAVFLLYTLCFILMIGNIEKNPGPESENFENNLPDKSISLCNVNIRSVRNKMEFLQTFSEDFDIILITESHLDKNIGSNDIQLESFNNPERKDRTNAGGGLLIYSKQDILIKRKYEFENDIDESIWVEIYTKGQSFLICNTYRPQWTDPLYWTRLNQAIECAYQFRAT